MILWLLFSGSVAQGQTQAEKEDFSTALPPSKNVPSQELLTNKEVAGNLCNKIDTVKGTHLPIKPRVDKASKPSDKKINSPQKISDLKTGKNQAENPSENDENRATENLPNRSRDQSKVVTLKSKGKPVDDKLIAFLRVTTGRNFVDLNQQTPGLSDLSRNCKCVSEKSSGAQVWSLTQFIFCFLFVKK